MYERIIPRGDVLKFTLGQNMGKTIPLPPLSEGILIPQEHIERARVHYRRKEYAEAVKSYGIAQKLDAYQAVYERALVFTGLRNFSRALSDLRMLEKNGVDTVDSSILKVRVYMKMGEAEKWRAAVYRLMERWPGNIRVCNILGHAHKNAGEYEEAAEEFEKSAMRYKAEEYSLIRTIKEYECAKAQSYSQDPKEIIKIIGLLDGKAVDAYILQLDAMQFLKDDEYTNALIDFYRARQTDILRINNIQNLVGCTIAHLQAGNVEGASYEIGHATDILGGRGDVIVSLLNEIVNAKILLGESEADRGESDAILERLSMAINYYPFEPAFYTIHAGINSILNLRLMEDEYEKGGTEYQY